MIFVAVVKWLEVHCLKNLQLAIAADWVEIIFEVAIIFFFTSAFPRDNSAKFILHHGMTFLLMILNKLEINLNL